MPVAKAIAAVGSPGLRLAVAAIVGLAALSLPISATASSTRLVIVEYSVPGANPNGIATGSDGNLWFTDPSHNSVDRFTLERTVTAYPVQGSNVNPSDITSGPDGNLWFLEQNTQGTNPPIAYVGKMTIAGVASQYPTGSGGFLSGIAVGPDGNVWFNEVDVFKVAKLTPGGVLTEYPNPNGPSAQEVGITAGPDGNLWVTDAAGNIVWRISRDGAFTAFNLPMPNRGATAITVGADGNLWFAEGSANQIGRMTTTGTLAEFALPTPNAAPVGGLSKDADGNVSFTEAGANQVGVISPIGVIHEYPIPTANSFPRKPTLGPDGHIWFPENDGNIAWIAGYGRTSDAIPPALGQYAPPGSRSTPPPPPPTTRPNVAAAHWRRSPPTI